jgi:hypothetical protein
MSLGGSFPKLQAAIRIVNETLCELKVAHAAVVPAGHE